MSIDCPWCDIGRQPHPDSGFDPEFEWCNARNPDDGTRCTRLKGHSGPHVACGLIANNSPEEFIGFGTLYHALSKWVGG